MAKATPTGRILKVTHQGAEPGAKSDIREVVNFEITKKMNSHIVDSCRVVDTVVGRAIVMVIFWSVAALKRLLAQGS